MTRKIEDNVWIGVFLALASLCIVFCNYVGQKEMAQAMKLHDIKVAEYANR